MKKLMTLSAILALSVATVAEAKRGGMARSVTGKAIPAQKTQSVSAAPQQNVNQTATPSAAAQQPAASQTRGSTLTNMAMGAAAGYMIGDMLSPNAAQANTAQPAAAANSAAPAAEFKSIGGQVDPYLVEKTDGYRRYCIAGVQYLASAQGGQSAPIVMINPNGSPLACNLVP